MREPIDFAGLDIDVTPDGKLDFDGDGIDGFDFVKFLMRPIPIWIFLAGVYFASKK